MGAPNTLVETSVPGVPTALDDPEGAAIAAAPLADIGAVLTALKEKDAQTTDSAAQVLDRRQAFFDKFHEVCEHEVRPAMEMVLERLRQGGGDGLIEEHSGGEPRVSTPRLVLWMSLQGPMGSPPRQDRNPYLQLDADVAGQVIRLTEGDSWRGASAGRSGTAGTWEPEAVTSAVVIRELAEIVRRSGRLSLA